MKAMILAAGLGSRLKPLTDNSPKVLLKAGPYTLLQFAILKLRSYGYNQLIINVHHHAQMVKDYLAGNDNFGCNIEISDETDKLLDTGGGLKKASWFFEDGNPFLVYNADIVSNINLNEFMDSHIQSQSMASLSVRNRPASRYLLFDSEMNLCGWENPSTAEKRIARNSESMQPMAFSGIHAVNPEIFSHMSDGKFSIIDTYLNLASDHQIKGITDTSNLWADAGKPHSLLEASEIAARISF